MIFPLKLIIKTGKEWNKKSTSIRQRKHSTLSVEGYASAGNRSSSSSSSSACKGNFVIYTADQKRFVIPLEYLCNGIFLELFKMSEEKYGHSSEAPIKLPCDAVFMEYAILLIQRGVAKGLEKALLSSINGDSCSLSASFIRGHPSQQLLICCSQNRMYWH
ncbi:hypothetical protein L6164_001386 [Bauhinia variegata]|uniref:Uncharacterized protein n=1 Tax=Bauhinia variegata TaxID=167791 RepID=A0ACB9Q9M9_BAUVA|nr:hypothetical protein L6164_001386 [Bauhinia variegata]